MSRLKTPPPPRTAPAGRSARSDASRLPSPVARRLAKTVALREAEAESVASIMIALPDPEALAPGTLVLVAAEVSSSASGLAQRVFAVLGRHRRVPRARRCSALVARGYVDVGAAEDDAGGDLTWGYVRASDDPSRQNETPPTPASR